MLEVLGIFVESVNREVRVRTTKSDELRSAKKKKKNVMYLMG